MASTDDNQDVSDDYRHRHMYFYHKFWDTDKDGTITRADFDKLGEHFAKIQRHGKVEKDVVERWQKYLNGWFDTLTKEAGTDCLKFNDWLRMCTQLAKKSDSFAKLPDFIKQHGQLQFMLMDAMIGAKRSQKERSGLLDAKNYAAFLKFSGMETARAKECFASMLSSNDMREHNSFLTRDRVDELIYEFWTDTTSPSCHGRYIMGPYDELSVEELEKRVTK